MTRTLEGNPPLNPKESLSSREVLDAYIINGARSLNRESETGSLEVGKSADFAVLEIGVRVSACSNVNEGIRMSLMQFGLAPRDEAGLSRRGFIMTSLATGQQDRFDRSRCR